MWYSESFPRPNLTYLISSVADYMDLTMFVHFIKNRGETGCDCCAWSLSAWSSKYLWKTTTQFETTMSMNWSSYCSWRPQERLPQQIGSASSSTDVAVGAKQGNCRATQTVSNRQLKRELTWHSHYAVAYNLILLRFDVCSTVVRLTSLRSLYSLRESNKGATIVLSITSRNVGRFSKFFHC